MKIPLPELGLDCEKKELKDCPFCGSDPEMKWSIVENLGHCFYVICPNKSCPCNDIWTNFRIVDKKIAIDLWNTRTAENEKSVLVIDEEKLMLEIKNISIKYSSNAMEEVWLDFLTNNLFKNATSFMSIEKE